MPGQMPVVPPASRAAEARAAADPVRPGRPRCGHRERSPATADRRPEASRSPDESRAPPQEPEERRRRSQTRRRSPRARSPSRRRRVARETACRVASMSLSRAGCSKAPSIARRTSAMSWNRCRRSFCRQRCRHSRSAAGVSRRERRPVGLRLDHVGEHLGDAVARERRRAGQHLVEHAAERPDVAALVDRPSARLLGAHVRRGAEQHAVLRATHGDRR